MNKDEFDAFRRSVEETFKSLYAIDVQSLTPKDKELHQELLTKTYLAVVRLENKAFEEITKKAMDKLAELSPRMKALQDQLAGFKKAVETLKIASGALDVMTAIVKLIK